MINWLIKKVIGSKNARLVRSMGSVVARINAYERECQKLSDDELKAKTLAWKGQEVSKIEDPLAQQLPFAPAPPRGLRRRRKRRLAASPSASTHSPSAANR